MTDILTTERFLAAAEKLVPGAAEVAAQAGNILHSLVMELRGFTPAATIEEAAANPSVTGAAHVAEEAYSSTNGLSRALRGDGLAPGDGEKIAHSTVDLGPPFVPRTGTVAEADLPKVWSWGSY